MRGWLKGCLIALASVVFLVLALAGTTYYLLTRPSPLAKELMATTPRPQAAQELETKIEALTEPGGQLVVKMEVTQEEINSLIARELPRIQEEMRQEDTPLTIKQVQVVLKENLVWVVAKVETRGLSPTIAVAARVTAEEGKPKIEIERMDLGRVPLPGLVKDQLNQLIERGLADFRTEELPFELRQLQVLNGKLILEGATKPKEGQ